VQVRFSLWWNDPGPSRETLARDSNLDFWVGAQVLQPVRGGILRDDVEPTVTFGKPYLNLSRAARFAPACSEIEILFAIEATGL